MTPDAADPPRRVGFAKTALYVVLMGILIGWASFSAMALAVRWEIPLVTVNRIPIFGFCAGAVLGLAMARSEPVRQAVWFVIGAIVLGWLVWLFVVVIVGLGLSVGGFEDEAFDRVMESVDSVATWLACLVIAAAIAAGAYAVIQDKTGALLERFRPKGRKAP